MALSEEQDKSGGKPLGILPVSEFLLVVALKNSKSYGIKHCCSLKSLQNKSTKENKTHPS
jgi:hypothetical protein